MNKVPSQGLHEWVQFCQFNNSLVQEAKTLGIRDQRNTYICEAAAPGERKDICTLILLKVNTKKFKNNSKN